MSSLARPGLAIGVLVAGGCGWCSLLVINLMLLMTRLPFVGNPLYTLLVGLTITTTVVGIQLRGSQRARTPLPPVQSVPEQGDLAGPRSASGLYYGNALTEATAQLRVVGTVPVTTRVEYAVGYLDGLAARPGDTDGNVIQIMDRRR